MNKFAIHSYTKSKISNEMTSNPATDNSNTGEPITKITYLRDNINNRTNNEYLTYSKYYVPDTELAVQGESFANVGEIVDRSIDPSICFFPNQSFIKKRAKSNQYAHGTRSNKIRGVFEAKIKDKYENSVPSKIQKLKESGLFPLRGMNPNTKENSIGFIYLNLKHLRNVYRELRYNDPTEDGEITFKEDFSLFKYLEKIWSDVNTANSNIHDFRIQTVHDDPNTVRVIDLQFDPEGLVGRDHLFEMNIEGKNSIVRDFNYHSTIPSSLSSTIAIAAQANSSIDDLDQVTFAAFNRNIKNRFSAPVPEDSKKVYTRLSNDLKSDLQSINNYFNQIESGINWYNGNIDTGVTTVHKETAFRMIQNV